MPPPCGPPAKLPLTQLLFSVTAPWLLAIPPPTPSKFPVPGELLPVTTLLLSVRRGAPPGPNTPDAMPPPAVTAELSLTVLWFSVTAPFELKIAPAEITGRTVRQCHVLQRQASTGAIDLEDAHGIGPVDRRTVAVHPDARRDNRQTILAVVGRRERVGATRRQVERSTATRVSGVDRSDECSRRTRNCSTGFGGVRRTPGTTGPRRATWRSRTTRAGAISSSSSSSSQE